MLKRGPYKRVIPNLIMAGWCTRIQRKSLRLKAVTNAISKLGKAKLFSGTEMDEEVGKWKDENDKNNIFHHSAFTTKYVYQFYCKKTL
jgi:hypothetical protein